ncbi:MAG: hypothetical protein KKH72_12165 [Alphaproteobacteria bacterium]|nr:hypothetical protein [Alphaproteobacteria bacterium]
MNEHIETKLPADEAELLLPFYVNGTLGEADRQAVESWLTRADDAAGLLARVTEELELTRSDAETLGMPSRQVLDKLMSEIGAAPSAARAPGLVERIWNMLSPRYALAGAAALCAVVALQAGYIVYSGQKAPAEYQTASGQAGTFAGPTALVVFAAGAEMSAIAARLAELDLVILDGPKPGGMFVVGARDSADGRAALSAFGRSEQLTQFFQLR